MLPSRRPRCLELFGATFRCAVRRRDARIELIASKKYSMHGFRWREIRHMMELTHRSRDRCFLVLLIESARIEQLAIYHGNGVRTCWKKYEWYLSGHLQRSISRWLGNPSVVYRCEKRWEKRDPLQNNAPRKSRMISNSSIRAFSNRARYRTISIILSEDAILGARRSKESSWNRDRDSRFL